LYNYGDSRNNALLGDRMAEWLSLAEAVAANVRDGDCIAMEGFTHLIPFAAGHEIVRQRRRELSLIRMTPDLIYDQLIGAGCAKKLTFSWGGNPGVGSLHRFRDAVENDWPRPLEIEERSHSDMANAYVAGASDLPFAVLRGYTGSDFARVNDNVRSVTCPFTGEVLAATPAVKPDVTVIHAQKADWKGNVLLWGILGVQKEAALAARRVIVTVEERVERLDGAPNACILPGWVVSAVCKVPRGAAPSYAHGYYERDNGFYRAWDRISRDREAFQAWIQKHILNTENFAEYLNVFGQSQEQAVYE
jgi:glutaconate CoA-transferase subunit A